jgi:3-methylcrotonyl-CoA carboxylase alpha subunit
VYRDPGHAFEARIYAENVPRGFLPATGTLHHYRPVLSSTTGNIGYIQRYNLLPAIFSMVVLTYCSSVRVETGVEQGDTVSMHYDPMIAKLVVWGECRNAALVKLKNCLSNFQVYMPVKPLP